MSRLATLRVFKRLKDLEDQTGLAKPKEKKFEERLTDVPLTATFVERAQHVEQLLDETLAAQRRGDFDQSIVNKRGVAIHVVVDAMKEELQRKDASGERVLKKDRDALLKVSRKLLREVFSINIEPTV